VESNTTLLQPSYPGSSFGRLPDSTQQISALQFRAYFCPD